MKQFFQGPLPDNARNLMRRIGYGEHMGRGGQLSYTKRLQGTPYPRYHAYVEDKDGGMQVNLHLDQKKASYEGSAAHGGEYDGPLVEREMRRITSEIQRLASAPKPSPTPQKKSSKGFWGGLFG